MKKICFIIFLFTNSIFAQKITYEEIILIDSTTSKETLFDRLNSRLIEYNGGQSNYDKNIIQSDRNAGVIKFKKRLEYDPKGNRSDDGVINFNVDVYFKKGRFKIILYDFVHEGKGISLFEITEDKEYPHEKSNFLNFRKKGWVEIKDFINQEIPLIMNKIEELVQKPIEQEKDW